MVNYEVHSGAKYTAIRIAYVCYSPLCRLLGSVSDTCSVERNISCHSIATQLEFAKFVFIIFNSYFCKK